MSGYNLVWFFAYRVKCNIVRRCREDFNVSWHNPLQHCICVIATQLSFKKTSFHCNFFNQHWTYSFRKNAYLHMLFSKVLWGHLSSSVFIILFYETRHTSIVKADVISWMDDHTCIKIPVCCMGIDLVKSVPRL